MRCAYIYFEKVIERWNVRIPRQLWIIFRWKLLMLKGCGKAVIKYKHQIPDGLFNQGPKWSNTLLKSDETKLELEWLKKKKSFSQSNKLQKSYLKCEERLQIWYSKSTTNEKNWYNRKLQTVYRDYNDLPALIAFCI